MPSLNLLASNPLGASTNRTLNYIQEQTIYMTCYKSAIWTGLLTQAPVRVTARSCERLVASASSLGYRDDDTINPLLVWHRSRRAGTLKALISGASAGQRQIKAW